MNFAKSLLRRRRARLKTRTLSGWFIRAKNIFIVKSRDAAHSRLSLELTACKAVEACVGENPQWTWHRIRARIARRWNELASSSDLLSWGFQCSIDQEDSVVEVFVGEVLAFEWKSRTMLKRSCWSRDAPTNHWNVSTVENWWRINSSTAVNYLTISSARTLGDFLEVGPKTKKQSAARSIVT